MTSRRILGFLLTDLLVTVIVIACVVTLLVSMIRHTVNVVRTAASAAEVMDSYRAELSAYHALRGDWPKNIEDLQAVFPHQPALFNDSFGKDIRIHGGAIDIPLRRRLAGKTLTLHPAVPVGEPLGPVKWVAGGRNGSDGWSIFGEDHTSVENKYILNILQR